ncbi:unnamed protein product [Peronospora belbahrii]|uniref:Centrosomin N-terminal motif 1 domain-containing protein n=1 Tax=Peronospora belbahrii TaxID=622444 RepID=A0AAU9KWL6_9STRA|nr:unnamed protein product [Peronospora belbahrii]
METPPPSSPRPQGSPWLQDDCSDGYSTPTSPTHHHAKILLRQQENEREQLRIDNFNRALRINYLEEQLLRFNQGLGFGSEQLESEVIQLRSSLDQRERDLRRRDSAMTRATQAMDLLSSRLKEAQEQVKQAKKHAQDQLQAQRQQFRQEQRDMEAKLTEKRQAQVENAYEREMSSQDAMQMLEVQLERQNQVVKAVTTQLKVM